MISLVLQKAEFRFWEFGFFEMTKVYVKHTKVTFHKGI